MPTFAVQNFGCRASQADGAALESQLTASGFSTEAPQQADFIILNTCTVTAAADDEVRQTIRRLAHLHPEARLVVTGCYAQRAPEELASLPGVAVVVGNSHKMRLAELLADESAPFHGEVHSGDIFAQHEFLSGTIEDAMAGRSRPNLKIQDGCNNRCSFCIIPFVRGRSRSAPVARVVEQVRALSERYSEVVLTGINLGRWGREAGMQTRLADLLRTLLAETSIGRLRLSSVEPMDFSDDLLQLMASTPRIAKHVHAPLQSGSDTVLRRMHRKYRPRHYEDRILKARQWMPDAAIGADVMVGFPGESEAEFQETVQFIERLPFTYLHVFPYSERPGTPAAEASGQVPVEIRKKRGRALKELAAAKNLAFRRSMLGRVLPAVTLQQPGLAITTNYLTIETAAERGARQLFECTIGALTENGLREQSLLPVLS
ncbi:MAG TPA: tRNA (N(6)-L-threonylcarbamoyladenosine(37)-C(2))-methylthiotransferase MtaB [Bryobacteraceae bacterium]|nr:tRNA (N(6)-L-threonylcarbamoyladenosine(37)-C(2))-methylthiotransferase MtaB [Bryobacteraceae bacterium]